MEFLTIVVRWTNPPSAHIHFLSEALIHWHLGRWKLENHTRADITVICAQVASVNVDECCARMLATLKHVDSNVMRMEGLGRMLVESIVFPYGNLYSVTHTDIQPGLSFLDHLTEIGKALSRSGWKQCEPFAVSDPSTSFKLQCNHEPHSVLVLLPGSRNLMIPVRCSEPQRIHELMKKYGLTCSGVFDSRVCVSARSPCIALCDYNMTVVNVTIIQSDDPFCDEPGLSNFYTTRHVQIRARRSTLRHKPYPSQHRTGDLGHIRGKGIRIALYYNAHRNDLIRVIKEDGRFLDDVHCTAPGTEQRTCCTQHLKPGSELILGNGARDPDDSEGSEGETASTGDREDSDVTVDSDDETARTGVPEDRPHVCFCCHGSADTRLSCGHLCCSSCLPQMTIDGTARCGVCRSISRFQMEIHTPINFTFVCGSCKQLKEWLQDCGHLKCECYHARCALCHLPSITLRRVFP